MVGFCKWHESAMWNIRARVSTLWSYCTQIEMSCGQKRMGWHLIEAVTPACQARCNVAMVMQRVWLCFIWTNAFQTKSQFSCLEMYEVAFRYIIDNPSRHSYSVTWGARGSVVVKALCYKPEGRGFDTRWGEFLNLPDPSDRLGFTQPLTEMSNRNIKIIMFLGSKLRRVRRADNLTAICEAIV
jgi:hypothetical protein